MPTKWLQEWADGSKNGHGIGFEGPGVARSVTSIVTPATISLVKQLVLVQILERDRVQKVCLVLSDLRFMVSTRNELLYKTIYGGRYY